MTNYPDLVFYNIIFAKLKLFIIIYTIPIYTILFYIFDE